jgi:hypothetical protein
MDQIESKLNNSLGLKIAQPLKVPPDVKTPSVWIRIRGDKAYISGQIITHLRRTLMALLQDLLVR